MWPLRSDPDAQLKLPRRDTVTGKLMRVASATKSVPVENGGAVGTEFAELVQWIPPLVPWWRQNGCDCKIWRDQMDKNGIEWCERNAHYLAKKIAKGVIRAGLWTPMMKTAIRLLINQAIWRARNPPR